MKIIIYMEPVGKGRARTIRSNGITRTYTPAKTADAETFIKYTLRQHFHEPYSRNTPLKLVVTFYRSRPKSLKKSVVRPVSRPDIDNYLKTVLDSMNGIAFVDDSQLVEAVISKRFAGAGEAPRIEVEITEV